MVEVKLISHTQAPIQTICRAWEASRNNDLMKPIVDREPTEDEVALFQQVIGSKIPVAEMVDFVFLLEGVSISLREQMVRHRIGVKVGDRIGMDIVPDLADSSWWSQSMRILDLREFATEGRYDVPESVRQNHKAYKLYHEAVAAMQRSYSKLADLGIPLEDARNVIPLAATHRIVWKLNLASLMHIVGKRGCWILQLGLWEPVIRGMVKVLAESIHPVFRRLIDPPCIKKDKFSGCLFCLDNERRIQGEDEIPPCPLYLNNHAQEAIACSVAASDPAWKIRARQRTISDVRNVEVTTSDLHRNERFSSMKDKYERLWGRDVWTGEKVD